MNVLRNGIKYEQIQVVTQAYVAAVPEILAQPSVPEILAQPEKLATYDANGVELTPYQPAIAYQAPVAAVAYQAPVAEIPEIKVWQDTGLQVGIEVDISADPTISASHTRKVELLNMIFENDLNIIVQAKINYYDTTGQSIIDSINADTTLTDDAKEYKKRQFQSYTLNPKSTRDSLVDVATKQVIVGTPISGTITIPELMLYQQMQQTDLVALGIAEAANETRPMQLVYSMVKLVLLQIVQRVGL